MRNVVPCARTLRAYRTPAFIPGTKSSVTAVVAAHLDEGRRTALAERILALGAQAWLTGTDTRLFEAFNDKAQTFEVSSGRVRQI